MADVGTLSLLLVCAMSSSLLGNQAESLSPRSDDGNPLEVVVQNLARDLHSLQGQLAAQKHELEAQRLRIAELEANNNRTVAFSAYISDEPHIVASKGSIVPFHGVITNTAAAYNPSTSVFTAPVDGDYFFIVHADVSTDCRSLQVTLNGRRVFAADNDGGDGHVTGSGLLKLKIGDAVSVTHYNSNGLVDAGNESTFTGFLVK